VIQQALNALFQLDSMNLSIKELNILAHQLGTSLEGCGGSKKSIADRIMADATVLIPYRKLWEKHGTIPVKNIGHISSEKLLDYLYQLNELGTGSRRKDQSNRNSYYDIRNSRSYRNPIWREHWAPVFIRRVQMFFKGLQASETQKILGLRNAEPTPAPRRAKNQLKTVL